MATDNKIERALHGPGFFEIIFSVLFSLALGVLLGALYLITKPVETVKELPKEVTPGTVYFVEGSANPAKSKQWSRKRQMLMGGSSADVSFIEEELNAWMAASLGKETPHGESVLAITPGLPNFRIRDGVLQLGVLSTLQAFGANLPLVFQTRGRFARGANGFYFTADELYLGSLPTHRLPPLKEFVIKRILDAQQIPPELTAHWSKLSLVAVEGDTLRVSLP